MDMKVINPNWKISKRYSMRLWANTTMIIDMDDELYKIGLIETLMFLICKVKVGD